MTPMEMPPTLLEKAALLRDKAARAIRLAAGLTGADRARLTLYGQELWEQATELERQAEAETPSHPPEPDVK